MLHGCIPVFIGPPWHSQPFVPELNYTTFSLFFHVKSFHQWVDQEAEQWVLDLWDLDQDVRNATRNVTELKDIEGVLRSLSRRHVVSKQLAISVARPAFLWKKRFDAKRPSITTTAIDFIYRRLCPEQESWIPMPADDFWKKGADDISKAHDDITEPGISIPYTPAATTHLPLQKAYRAPGTLPYASIHD